MPHDSFVRWHATGKPEVTGSELNELNVSLSHDDDVCVAVAGVGPQGVDVLELQERSREDWKALLGDVRTAILDDLVARGDSEDLAGARIWAALEAVRKAGAEGQTTLEVVR